ncbi:MAG TPA: hypothetical protein VNE67_08425 [Acetobacteraceae bacterium]|nr:hypothetical protein [Acetobacteraceae bacterium]
MTRVLLLGWLGAGLAKTGDLDGSERSAMLIAALLHSAPAPNPALSNFAIAALTRIGDAMSADGAADRTLNLLSLMPDGLEKLRFIDRIALVTCGRRPSHKADPMDRQRIDGLITQSGHDAIISARSTYLAVHAMAYVVIALALCGGHNPTYTFVMTTVPAGLMHEVLFLAANDLAAHGEIQLSKAVTPALESADAETLLATADLLMKQGDRIAALRSAREASAAALRFGRMLSKSSSQWLSYTGLLGKIFYVLVKLGDYEAAVVTVRATDLISRQQYYVATIEAEAAHKDQLAIMQTLPLAIKAVSKPAPPLEQRAQYLYELANTLTKAGFGKEARKPYERLVVLLDRSAPGSSTSDEKWKLALLQADMGDLPRALQIAHESGPLVQKPTNGMLLFMAGDVLGHVEGPIDSQQLARAMRTAKSLLPPLVAGPRAYAFGGIAQEMAAQGHVNAAIEAESGLEKGPSGVVDGPRDGALAAIAMAQTKKGNVRDALATVLRIATPTDRLDAMIRLAAIAPSH